MPLASRHMFSCLSFPVHRMRRIVSSRTKRLLSSWGSVSGSRNQGVCGIGEKQTLLYLQNFWQMTFHITTIMLSILKWYNCALQFQRSEKCVCPFLWHVPIQFNLFQKYGVLMDEDTNLITYKNLLQYCAVFPANDQCHSAYSFAFLPSTFTLANCISLCFNHFMKKVNGTWVGPNKFAESSWSRQTACIILFPAPQLLRIHYLVPL